MQSQHEIFTHSNWNNNKQVAAIKMIEISRILPIVLL